MEKVKGYTESIKELENIVNEISCEIEKENEWSFEGYLDESEKHFLDRADASSKLRAESNYFNYIQSIKDYRVLPHEELMELFKQWKEEKDIEKAKDLKEIIFLSNLRLVITFSKKFLNQGLDSMELIQEGNIGLDKAINRFDYASNNRFSTYAIWWVRQTIQRAIQNTSRAIRVPIHIGELYNRVRRAQRELNAILGREPNNQEIADHLGVELKRVEHAIKSNLDIISTETPVNNKKGDDSVTLAAFVSDSEDNDPAKQAMNEIMIKKVRETLKWLPEKEAEILKARYGIDGIPPMSLEQTGAKFGLSRERIRQIEKDAREKLKDICLEMELDEFIQP